MIKLGIIGAMQVEVEILLEKMEDRKTTVKAGTSFCEGKLEGLDAVVVQCGVGKVNAAICAQMLCDLFAVTHIVNTGIAGSLNADLDIGDLVVSSDAMYHDMDAVHFGYEFGKVPGMDTVAFPADKKLMNYAFTAAEAVNPGHFCQISKDFLPDGFRLDILFRIGHRIVEPEGMILRSKAFPSLEYGRTGLLEERFSFFFREFAQYRRKARIEGVFLQQTQADAVHRAYEGASYLFGKVGPVAIEKAFAYAFAQFGGGFAL